MDPWQKLNIGCELYVSIVLFKCERWKSESDMYHAQEMEQVREQNNELRRRTQVMVFPLAAPLISFAVLPVACNPYGAGGGADYWRAASRQRSAADPSTSILTTRDSSIVSARSIVVCYDVKIGTDAGL